MIMKHLNNIILLISMTLFVSSCQLNPDKTQIIGDADVKAPVLYSPGDIVVNKDNVKTESIIFNWEPADFGASVQIEYILYLQNGEISARLASSFSTTATVSKTDINGVATAGIGVPKNVTQEISAYLVAKVYGTDVHEVKSTPVSFNITTFEAPLRWLFMPGTYQGWDIDHAPQFWETDGGTNLYSTMVDMNLAEDDANRPYSYFKITVARNWSDDNWGYNFLTPSWTCPEQGDSNLSVNLKEGSIYIFTVNRSAMTIDKKPVSKVGLIGAFAESDGWANDIDFTYDASENVWISPAVTFSDNLEFLVRLNGTWDNKYGDGEKDSDKVEGGRILEKGGGPNLSVPEAGIYVMKLHANRTPFVLVMEKQ